MKSTPILFRGDMVQAILAGQKTQTRREVKLPKWIEPADHAEAYATLQQHPKGLAMRGKADGVKRWFCPFGTAGDELWVRETTRVLGWNHVVRVYVEYLADGAQETREIWDVETWHRFVDYRTEQTLKLGGKWVEGEDAVALPEGIKRPLTPSLNMPRWACRLLLTITDVRVERVQDISEADARAEGISDEQIHEHGSARAAFAALWDSIHGDTDHEWGKNPFVWVVEFSRKEQA